VNHSKTLPKDLLKHSQISNQDRKERENVHELSTQRSPGRKSYLGFAAVKPGCKLAMMVRTTIICFYRALLQQAANYLLLINISFPVGTGKLSGTLRASSFWCPFGFAESALKAWAPLRSI